MKGDGAATNGGKRAIGATGDRLVLYACELFIEPRLFVHRRSRRVRDQTLDRVRSLARTECELISDRYKARARDARRRVRLLLATRLRARARALG